MRAPERVARAAIARGSLRPDVAGELAGYADDLDADPLRLAAVEERRAALTAQASLWAARYASY
ncbi:hypothetical protein [Streptomyces sp. NPDC049915]|uniref:hypothetical protein n=1 Tax=Streptomyces sp. NPDC049915 TaxID=3155510 RepID=UPI0034355E0B